MKPYIDPSKPREVVRAWWICFQSPPDALFAERDDTYVIDRVTYYDHIKVTRRPSSRAGVERYALHGIDRMAVKPCDMAAVVGIIRKNKIAAWYRLAGDAERHDIGEDMNWET